MDIHALRAILNNFFLAIISDYANGVSHATQEALLDWLNRYFWAPFICQQGDSGAFYTRVQYALIMFDSKRREKNMSAVGRAGLLEWDDIFARIFNNAIRREIRNQRPPHASVFKEFDIWNFLTPTMTVNQFLELLNRHISAFRGLHDLEGVVLNQQQIIRKPGRRAANAQPTKGTNHDPNFYHRCMFCTHIDTNTRPDVPEDHMQRYHNYYSSVEDQYKRACEHRYQKRKTPTLLRALLVKERAIYDSQAMRLHEAKKSIAMLRPDGDLLANRIPPLADEDEDPSQLTGDKLAKKLCAERARRMHGDASDENICKKYTDAWELKETYSYTYIFAR